MKLLGLLAILVGAGLLATGYLSLYGSPTVDIAMLATGFILVMVGIWQLFRQRENP